MPRQASALELVLGERPPGVALTSWLYDELRAAIVAGRLPRGARLPATRDLAAHCGVSRGVVVSVFEQLGDEGYLTSRVGAGTTVRARVAEDYLVAARHRVPPARPAPAVRTVRPFSPIEQALAEFPMKTWARIAARVLSRTTPRSLSRGDPAGLRTLREAVAGYLGASRGVACSPDHVVIVAGAQQALDLVARLVIHPGDPVWIEDPGYPGAVDAFRNARARIVPVRVDDDGLDPDHGKRRCARPVAVYLTPAHQFCLGVALSAARRRELVRWANATGTVLVEDDYDSEFRYVGRPIPAMRGLDAAESVFLIGTFSKVLFPSLRLGYLVVPDAWIDRVLALRYQLDLYPPAISQAILTDFLVDGHFARHLRRMRERYGARRAALEADVERYLAGVLRLPEIRAGLSTPAYLCRGVAASEIIERGATRDLDLWSLDRYALRRRDLRGLLLGFAAFTEREIRDAVVALARVIEEVRAATRVQR
jgi:GntR family transcriptional regulator/MocR family aminotransferase